MANSNSLNVLLISNVAPPIGGIATWTDIILEESNKNNSLNVISVDTSPPSWRSLNNTKTHIRLIAGFMSMWRILFNTLKEIVKIKIDVIHLCSHGSFALIRDLIILQIAKILKIRSIYHIRQGRIPQIANINNWEWKLFKNVLSLPTTIIPIDQLTFNTVREYFPYKDIQKIPNTARQPKHTQNNFDVSGRNNDLVKLIFIGHVNQNKGIEELIEACITLDHLKFELNIVGTYEEDYKNLLIDKYNFDRSKIRLIGELSHQDTMQYLANSDILLLPSYTEGFPNVILEAMALGIAVIATDVGAISEMLNIDSMDPCGLLIPPKDSKSIEASIIQLSQHPDRREQLAKNGKDRFDNQYSIKIVFNKITELWFGEKRDYPN